MINHFTCFLNKCVLALRRDIKPPSALVFSVSRMTSISVVIPHRKDVYIAELLYQTSNGVVNILR